MDNLIYKFCNRVFVSNKHGDVWELVEDPDSLTPFAYAFCGTKLHIGRTDEVVYKNGKDWSKLIGLMTLTGEYPSAGYPNSRVDKHVEAF